jgi:hypothetical protein
LTEVEKSNVEEFKVTELYEVIRLKATESDTLN